MSLAFSQQASPVFPVPTATRMSRVDRTLRELNRGEGEEGRLV
jgi:hypothetical protein